MLSITEYFYYHNRFEGLSSCLKQMFIMYNVGCFLNLSSALWASWLDREMKIWLFRWEFNGWEVVLRLHVVVKNILVKWRVFVAFQKSNQHIYCFIVILAQSGLLSLKSQRWIYFAFQNQNSVHLCFKVLFCWLVQCQKRSLFIVKWHIS